MENQRTDQIRAEEDRQLAVKYQPHIQKDRLEPIPLEYMGYTVFRGRGDSPSFDRLTLDPAAVGAEMILEYAIYYDYDIQHLYDLEHVWVAVDAEGAVTGCWSSFHGMRLRAHKMASFRVEGTHPVLYEQPGKHALLPDPELFWLHAQFPESCRELAGGGLLIKPMFADAMETNPERDERIRRHILREYAFTPSLEYVPETVPEDRVIPWEQLKALIPERIKAELERIEGKKCP